MGILSKETRALQNPALGAVLLWKFADAYHDASPIHSGAPMPLLFVVLPMILQENVRSVILSTRKNSSLRTFAEKFSTSKMAQADVVLALQSRMAAMKRLTMDSVQIMIGCGMATIDVETGLFIPSKTRGLKQQIPDGVDLLVRSAEYLGNWMAGLSVYETAVTLRLFF
jgi:hypothetical protein